MWTLLTPHIRAFPATRAGRFPTRLPRRIFHRSHVHSPDRRSSPAPHTRDDARSRSRRRPSPPEPDSSAQPPLIGKATPLILTHRALRLARVFPRHHQ